MKAIIIVQIRGILDKRYDEKFNTFSVEKQKKRIDIRIR